MDEVLLDTIAHRPVWSAAGVADAEEDTVLAQQAQASPAAFAQLYRRHFARVYRYVLARIGNTQDAQDLTSQTFLAALEGIGGYRGRGSLAAWLLGIARHKLGDHFRRRRPELPLEVASQLPHPNEWLDETVEHRLRLERLALALQALTPERAEALALRIFGKLSAAEAGLVMGKSEAAIRMLVYRAVRDLQARLLPAEEVENERSR